MIGALYYTLWVYRMKFYQQYLGFKEDQSGIVQTVWNLTSFVGVTGWSNLADYHGTHRLLLIILCLGMAGTFELIALKNFVDQRWWVYLASAVFGLFGAVSSGVMPLTDYHILNLLKKYGADEVLYGRQVLFGTVAYGLVTYGLGVLIEAKGFQVLFWLMPIVATAAAVTIGLFGYAGKIDTGTSDKTPVSDADDESGEREDTKTISSTTSLMTYLRTLTQARFIFFLSIILSIGVGRQVLSLFLPYYLSEDLKLSPGRIGQIYLLSNLISPIFLFTGPYFLARMGVRPMLWVGLMALTVRLFAYSIITPGQACFIIVMLIELLNGISFSFTHLSGVREASACAPPGWEATFQAVYTLFYVQFPAVFVSLGGGWMYKWYGGLLVMQTSAALSLIALTLLTIFVIVTKIVFDSRNGKTVK